MSVEQDNIAVLDNGEDLTIVSVGDDAGQAVNARGAIAKSAASKSLHNATEKTPQLSAEELARKAEKAFQKFGSFVKRFAALGHQKLDAAMEVGRHLNDAKEILAHGEFEKELKRWHADKTITFAPRSARRYTLLATHAETIKSAKLANIDEAEKYVASLDHNADTQGADANESAQLSRRKEPDPVEQCEARILNDLRRLNLIAQRPFLETLITKLSERLQSLPQ